MNPAIKAIIGKHLNNPKVLEALAVKLLEKDEEYDGQILAEEDFETLNEFAEVF